MLYEYNKNNKPGKKSPTNQLSGSRYILEGRLNNNRCRGKIVLPGVLTRLVLKER